MFSKGLLIGKRPFQDGDNAWNQLPFSGHITNVPKTHYFPAEYLRPHCKQDERSSLPCFAVSSTLLTGKRLQGPTLAKATSGLVPVFQRPELKLVYFGIV